MRLIDADDIVYDSIDSEDTNRHAYYYGTGIMAVRKEDIDDAPTIDAVEVVRCKDCKHYYFAENRVPEEQSWVCDAWHVNQTAHMGYCFKAERKSNEIDRR